MPLNQRKRFSDCKDGERKGRQGDSCASGTRTIRMCSFDGRSRGRPNGPSNGIEGRRLRNYPRSEGQSGCSPRAKWGKSKGPRLG